MKSIIKEQFLAQSEWQNNYILSNVKDDIKAIWLFAILWNAVCLPFIWYLPDIIKRDVSNAFVLSPFLIMALYLLYSAITRTKKMRQLGETALVMQSFPGIIGTDIGGTILINTPYTPDTECEVKLQSIYTEKVRTIQKKYYRHRIQWYKETEAQITATKKGTKLQFNFSVPKGLRESEKPSDKYYHWLLKIKLINAYDTIERSYEIPVFNDDTLNTGEIKNDRPETNS